MKNFDPQRLTDGMQEMMRELEILCYMASAEVQEASTETTALSMLDVPISVQVVLKEAMYTKYNFVLRLETGLW